MTKIKVNPATVEFIENQPKFSTCYSNKSDGQTELFSTLEEATTHYNSIDVMDFSNVGSSYWYNNKDGKEAELRELTELPISLIEELNDCNNDAEMMDVYMKDDVHHTYSNRIETKYSYLSDEWDETLGEDGEYVIKENKVYGITYSTHFSEPMISISDLIKR